ncbi:MAG TPA: IS5 family transposase [Acidimicrobiales bacterium]
MFDVVWTAVEPLLPPPKKTHPLGCHRRRVSDRTCFRAMLIRLVTGCSWVDAEQLVGGEVSDTTLRSRRDEWEKAGVFDRLVEEALSAYDKIIGLDLTEVALDGFQHKAPGGGEGTGKSPVDRGKLGWKWSILTDRAGIPIGWATNGANRHDNIPFAPTLRSAKDRGLLADVETLHLDRGYDSQGVRTTCRDLGLGDVVCARQRRDNKQGLKRPPVKAVIGPRWPVERTNSWLSNFGQLRRSTDRSTSHRLALVALAVTLLLTAKLIDWRDRWSF